MHCDLTLFEVGVTAAQGQSRVEGPLGQQNPRPGRASDSEDQGRQAKQLGLMSSFKSEAFPLCYGSKRERLS